MFSILVNSKKNKEEYEKKIYKKYNISGGIRTYT